MGLLLRWFCGLLAALPRRVAIALGRGAGAFLGSALRFRRREVLAAMQRAFPEKSRGELTGLASRMYRHLGTTVVETARLAVLGRKDLDGLADVVRDEHHQRLVAQPGGSLLLMGHIGNWELTSVLTSTLPHPVHAIVKPLKPASLNQFIARTRAILGLRLMSFRGDFGEALRALRRGETVAVILDQNQRRTMGVFVDFLGESACTSHGLAILSSMSGAPVFPIYSFRRPDGSHEVHVLPPLAPPPDRQPDTLQRFTQQYTRALEDVIRAHPEQWMWIHRRWRTRPVSEDGGQRTENRGQKSEVRGQRER